MAQATNRFSALLLEGLDHYRKGRMIDAVRAWEEAYLLEPTNLRAREFLRSALERIHAVMTPANRTSAPAPVPHPWLPSQPATPAPETVVPPKQVPPAKQAKQAAAPARKAPPPPPARNPWDDGPSLAIPQP